MESLFAEIFAQLADRGIQIDPAGPTLHASQGFMSSVYELESESGPLIVHLVRPIPEHVRNRTWEKLSQLSALLASHSDIPTAEVVCSGTVGEQYFIVQRRLPGVPAGTRALSDSSVIDTWTDPTQIEAIERILAKIHGIQVIGAGWPLVAGDALVGRYASWTEFFRMEIPAWLESMRRADALEQSEDAVPLEKIQAFTEHALRAIEDVPCVLIHGDAINPSNVLIQDGTITGLLDWEWSIFGDPAWEFCDPGWETVIRTRGVDAYLTAAGYTTEESKEEFLSRITLYRPLWNLWAAHIHSNVESNPTERRLYRILRNLLDESLRAVGFA